MEKQLNNQVPTVEHPENLEAIEFQKQSGDFAPAEQQDQFPGYEEYPPEEDAFVAGEIVPFMEEGDVPPPIEDRDPDAWNEATLLTGDDLDVPGSELDDLDEEIGREDEENNYYSLGGDKDDDNEAQSVLFNRQ